MPTKPVLVIRNDAHEGAGLLASLLAKRGIEQHTVFGFATDFGALRHEKFSALVVLGGVQSAYETDKYPYLIQEIELCRNFLAEDKAIAGFCLGAQILAFTLGGEVVAGRQKEIGWYDLSLHEAAAGDALTRDLPKKFVAYHFHGDVIRPAPNCTNLASSAMTECQLFRCGAKAYGFQYHAEADRPLIEVMCRNNANYLASNGLDAEGIITESRTHAQEFERHSSALLSRWINLFASA